MDSCEQCQRVAADVRYRPSRTDYARDRVNCWSRLLFDDELHGQQPDPNRDVLLCDECCVDYNLYWDEMWDMWYANR